MLPEEKKTVETNNQMALNKELNEEITKSVIDFDKVRSLLDKGANPLGQYDLEYDGDIPFDQCLINCQKLPTEDFQATAQLPDLTALLLDYGMDFDTCEIPVLHSLTWLKHEYGIKTLNVLLERGLSVSDADYFVEDLIGDMLQFGRFDEDCARDDGVAVRNRYSYALKMAMLVAAYHTEHLDICKAICTLIEPRNNDISKLPAFRNWNDFRYITEETPGEELCGRRVSIYNKEGKCVWSFVLKGFLP